MHEPMSIGELLRRLRADAGRSQSEQADALSERAGRAVTRNEVSRWETEKRMLTPYWQQHHADSFGIPVAIVKRAVATAKAKRRLERQVASPEGGSVERREFIGAIAGLAVSLPGIGLDLPSLDGPGRGAVDPQVIDHFIRLRDALVSADSLLGPGNLVRSAREQVGNIAKLYERIESSSRGRLFEVGALFAEFSGWLADDLGNFEAGRAWSSKALEWSHSSGNPDIAAFILMRMSQQAQFLGERAPAVTLAQASVRYDGQVVSSHVRAAIHQQAAHASALDGQERAALDYMDRAQALADAAQPTDDPYMLGSYCTSSYVAVQRAAMFSTLGNDRRALDEYDHVMQQWPRSFHRERGLHLARRTMAAARAGLPEAALESGTEALKIARETQSHRTVRELTTSTRLMLRWQALPGVVEFIRAVTSEGDSGGSAQR
ncbi:transcriptional regulator with XRE-family HTH domain [Saccharothrix ecbatanensis]|uniref:Transcriptional regulator with XRE-family HTH domain n=1 Tax=Saccharothrix ecbatanensis TaxID=1105145 RepID=A0A7W9M4D1_9PSEU|nr:helix-turn-helix transcriptional regulator [Saccharothrix ecbatanensis]MBB5806982.1 transcriptional regulator with XRE-family HTH domain [Saccharothrix ecbatanensis]